MEIQGYGNSGDSRNLYNAIRSVYGPITSGRIHILDSDGKQLLSQNEDILKRWREYYSLLLNREPSADKISIQNLIPQQEELPIVEADIAFEEVETAVNQLKDGRSPGLDNIPGEVFKYGGSQLLIWLHKIILKVWDCGCVPQDWRDAAIVSIYKNKGARNDCNSYRGISLLAVAGKIFGRILMNRIVQHLDSILPESQCCFRKERSTIDMIFSLRQIQEKCVEQRMDLVCIFIDLMKAYDSVDREALWLVLKKFGFPDKIVALIQSLHEGMKARVTMFGELSEEFDIKNGLRQGCILAPSLFNVYFTVVLLEALQGLSNGIAIRYKLDGKLFDVRRLRGRNALYSLIQSLIYGCPFTIRHTAYARLFQ